MATAGNRYQQGYDDSRFEIVVSERFHCSICLLVLKDPVMCKNQHYYCSSCIKEHLANSQFCPTCRVHLSVETLIQAPRIVTNYISELNIHCDFYPRGCRKVIQLSNLKRHVASCGFSPVKCSNDGCNVLVNKKDKLHHEAEVCDFRKSKCHDCSRLKKEVKNMKEEMLRCQDQIKGEVKDGISELKNEMEELKDEMNEFKDEIKDELKVLQNEVKVMTDQVLARQERSEYKITNETKQEVKNQIEIEMKEMRKETTPRMKEALKGMKQEMRNEMKKEMQEVKKGVKNEMRGMKEEMKNEIKEVVMNAARDAMAEKNDLNIKMRSSQATCSTNVKENIIVTGGAHQKSGSYVKNKSTECFNWNDQTWKLLDVAVFEGRSETCSFLYQGQMVVAGGFDNDGNKTNTLKCLNVADQAATWKDFPVNLPVKCADHQVVYCNDRLFMTGGLVPTFFNLFTTHSDEVNEVHLVPPYTNNVLTRLPQPRSRHGMEIFDNRLFILGGFDGYNIRKSVVQYDFIKKECKEMPPMPYAVGDMATVLWRNNVLVIGGRDGRYIPMNTLLMYDVITGRYQMLPRMKAKRFGCTAVLTGNMVVVMGGRDEHGGYLKSVECFDLGRRVWRDLPDMLEPRAFATAVVIPNY